ncbi:hypothetical protein BLA23254_03899 [Burkholderia lata]|uniref:DUF4365 domain-containing protein n=1 Tax=Burkholderia lata (strain ATCC 17760 / DSM 23089 / LMG 22485 / NCIMB 9086 / R18194 / 383) TaxID=482957 RepID=A0A6P2MTS7_BURL3|nr:DUF4365 domain-containing protein [Burkholderia lata]VWB82629.1 hypothetical protein BLA23254_03899 [Burkholderia lata]
MARYVSTERVGVNAVEHIVLNDLGWIFREQPVVDMGIDAHIELVDGGQPTGKLIAVQIKTGPSHFQENADAYIFRGTLTHLDYWTNHSLPVILVAHLPESNRTHWVYVDVNKVHRAEKSWTISVPKTNVLSRKKKDDLAALFEGSPSQQRMRKLAIDEPLMRHIQRGGKVSVELEDWINKGLSRSNVEVFVHDKDGHETLAHKWLFYHTGRDMKLLAERIFPWSVASLDEEFYEENEEFYDGYDAGWGMNREYGCGSSTPDPDVILPYTNDSGEVDRYRLKLKLSKLGRAYLLVSNYAAGLADK